MTVSSTQYNDRTIHSTYPKKTRIGGFQIYFSFVFLSLRACVNPSMCADLIEVNYYFRYVNRCILETSAYCVLIVTQLHTVVSRSRVQNSFNIFHYKIDQSLLSMLMADF